MSTSGDLRQTRTLHSERVIVKYFVYIMYEGPSWGHRQRARDVARSYGAAVTRSAPSTAVATSALRTRYVYVMYSLLLLALLATAQGRAVRILATTTTTSYITSTHSFYYIYPHFMFPTILSWKVLMLFNSVKLSEVFV